MLVEYKKDVITSTHSFQSGSAFGGGEMLRSHTKMFNTLFTALTLFIYLSDTTLLAEYSLTFPHDASNHEGVAPGLVRRQAGR